MSDDKIQITILILRRGALSTYAKKDAVDKSKFKADSLGGWDFRPYSPVLWRWLRATFQHTPFMLSSATLSTESLERIKVSLGIDREEVLVLSSSCDRPNVYQQSRRLHRRVDVWYAEYDFRKRDLHFIPAGTSTRT